jgi:hypothetical protein
VLFTKEEGVSARRASRISPSLVESLLVMGVTNLLVHSRFDLKSCMLGRFMAIAYLRGSILFILIMIKREQEFSSNLFFSLINFIEQAYPVLGKILCLRVFGFSTSLCRNGFHHFRDPACQVWFWRVTAQQLRIYGLAMPLRASTQRAYFFAVLP